MALEGVLQKGHDWLRWGEGGSKFSKNWPRSIWMPPNSIVIFSVKKLFFGACMSIRESPKIDIMKESEHGGSMSSYMVVPLVVATTPL